MKYLTPESFKSARAFIKSKARRIDLRRFEYYFENGTVDAVLEELSRFQNDDGGFGHALEPDLRLPASSPMATTIALEIASDLATPSEHPLIQRAIEYLLGSYDPVRGYWRATPREVNDYPHAPWWTYPDKTSGLMRVNPTAEVTGYLNEYRDLVPSNFLVDVTRAMLEHLEMLNDPIEMHDIFCLQRMAVRLPEPQKSRTVERLKQAVAAVVGRDPQKWAEYSPQPLMFASAPDSPFAPPIRDLIELNLDYQIDKQSPDGCWLPNWTWGGSYPDAWVEAQREWSGNLTVEALHQLKAFGRIT